MRIGDTPVPIPNTTVKTDTAESTLLETAREDRWLQHHGGVAQLGEHLPCKQGVMSSNLTISTTVRDDGSAGEAGRKEYFENRISKDLKFSEKYQSQDIEKYLIVKNQKQETTRLDTNAMVESQLTKVKRRRAQEGCLGTKSRRKT